MTTEEENIFIDKIDCNFPYHDRQECIKLIDTAATFSTNAMFAVIAEICRVPHSEKENVTTEFLLDLLSQTKSKFNHPLKEIVLDTADKMIQGTELKVDNAIAKMKIIKKYPGQLAALSILYFSCDDKDGKLEPVWKDIMNDWKNNAT
jgi:hypothetical protein